MRVSELGVVGALQRQAVDISSWGLKPEQSGKRRSPQRVQGLGRDSGRGTTRAEDAQGKPTQSHISPSILVDEDKRRVGGRPWLRTTTSQKRAAVPRRARI